MGTTPMRQGTALTTTTNASTITEPNADAQSNTARHDLPRRSFLMHGRPNPKTKLGDDAYAPERYVYHYMQMKKLQAPELISHAVT